MTTDDDSTAAIDSNARLSHRLCNWAGRGRTVDRFSGTPFSPSPKIRQTLSAESAQGFLGHPIWQSPSAKSRKGVPAHTMPGTGSTELIAPGQTLLEWLSLSLFAELSAVDDPLKRAFYEIECIRGNWPVRALEQRVSRSLTTMNMGIEDV